MFTARRKELMYVKGVGPKRAELLKDELGLKTVYDLLHHFPSGYLDRSKTYSIRSLQGAGEELSMLQLKGRFVTFNTLGEGAKMRLVGLFSDGTATMECVWFRGINQLKKKLNVGVEYVLFGKPTHFNGILQMAHPELDTPDAVAHMPGIRGVYPLTEKLRQRYITSVTLHTIITDFLKAHTTPFQETLPPDVIAKNNLMGLDEAIRTIHLPDNPLKLDKARFRLKFEELFFVQTDILRRSRAQKAITPGYYMPHVGRWFNDFFYQCLPFELTGAQKRVIKEIRADIMGTRQMNRLVQGDVGSGKTLVALMSMLLAVDNGFQACLMAPTEILATQHHETISKLTAAIGLNVKLLTGSTKAKDR